MLEHVELFFRSIFIDNMIFATFLGMCSYLAVSKKVTTAVGLGAAVIFVLGVTVPLNWLLDQYLLRDGALSWLGPEYADYNLSFLSFILFIATIATMVQLVEIVVEKFSPALYNSLGIFLPLIAVNCAILGGSLFMQSRDIQSFGLAFNYGVSSGIGWFLANLGHCRHPRKDQVLQRAGSFKGTRHYIYHHRFDGHRLPEFRGHAHRRRRCRAGGRDYGRSTA